MNIDWHVVIPVVWAIVSTVLALILYKTSDGVFEQKIGDQNTKRVRLVGSIVIAGAIFVALKWATPTSILLGEKDTSKEVPKEYVDSVLMARERLQADEDALQACLAVTTQRQCSSEITQLKRSVDLMLSLTSKL